jgi:hypothetical protein
MPISSLNKTEALVSRLRLSFPYDWSNPAIPEDALILNVLRRGIFVDICRICVYFGVERVEALAKIAFKDTPSLTFPRMIKNIRAGFADE